MINFIVSKRKQPFPAMTLKQLFQLDKTDILPQTTKLCVINFFLLFESNNFILKSTSFFLVSVIINKLTWSSLLYGRPEKLSNF